MHAADVPGCGARMRAVRPPVRACVRARARACVPMMCVCVRAYVRAYVRPCRALRAVPCRSVLCVPCVRACVPGRVRAVRAVRAFVRARVRGVRACVRRIRAQSPRPTNSSRPRVAGVRRSPRGQASERRATYDHTITHTHIARLIASFFIRSTHPFQVPFYPEPHPKIHPHQQSTQPNSLLYLVRLRSPNQKPPSPYIQCIHSPSP